MSDLPHGSIQAFWLDKALIIEVSDDFNREGVIAAGNRLKQLIAHKPAGEWMRVYVMLDTLGPMTAIPNAVESVKFGIEHGCKALGLVGGNVLNKEMTELVAEASSLPLFFFDSVEEVSEFLLTSDLFN